MVPTNIAPRNIFAYRRKKKLNLSEFFQVLKILEFGSYGLAVVASFSYRFQYKGTTSAHKRGTGNRRLEVFSEMYYTENFDEY